MTIYELNKEQKEVAMKIIMSELKNIGFELNINNSADRLKAEIIATNLRIKFNQLGGLA